MKNDIDEYCTSCNQCQKNNQPAHKRPPPLDLPPKTTRAFQRVHFDLLQLPLMSDGFKYAIVFVDAFSKWCEIFPLKDKTAASVAKATLQGWIARFGLPKSFHSDQGTEFHNELFEQITQFLGINHSFSTPLHPQSNGLVERQNRQIIAHLRKFWDDKVYWPEQLAFVAMAHNTTPSLSTQLAPYTAIFGCPPTLPCSFQAEDKQEGPSLSQLSQQLQDLTAHVVLQQQKASLAQKRQFDKNCKVRQFDVGDVVFLSATADPSRPKKMQSPFQGPYLVIRCLPNSNYLVKNTKNSRLSTVHVHRLKAVSTKQPWAAFSHSPLASHEEQACHAFPPHIAEPPLAAGSATSSGTRPNLARSQASARLKVERTEENPQSIAPSPSSLPAPAPVNVPFHLLPPSFSTRSRTKGRITT